MKLYDENKNLVANIEKPEPIEQDGKWWELVELRTVKSGEKYLYNKRIFTAARHDEHRGYQKEVWIASEIPRATSEQLKAIGMKERDGRPVLVKFDEAYWSELGKLYWCKYSAIYRFVLVPDVQKEVHTSCEGCSFLEVEKFRRTPCYNCGQPDMERKNYTSRQPDEYRMLGPDEIIQKGDEYKDCNGWIPAGSINYTVKSQRPLAYRRKIEQPAQPEEPRFSVEEIKIFQEWILGNLLFNGFHEEPIDQKDYNAAIRHLAKCIFDNEDGIAAFTERRHNVR